MELTEEQLNFLTRLNLQGSLTSDFLGDRLIGKDCDENAEKQCKLLELEGYIYNKGYGY